MNKFRDGCSVTVNIGIFWGMGIGIGWTKKHSVGIGIGIGKYRYFWDIVKNNTDPPSLIKSAYVLA